MSKRLSDTPAAARFLRKAGPAIFKQISDDRKRPVLAPPLKPDLSTWNDRDLHVAWIGHSTVLLKVAGFTILTDPVFSLRAGLNLGPVTIGIKRLVDAALKIEELPKIDLILLSHAHMDHFDIPSLRQLESPETTVVTAVRTSDLLRPSRYSAVHELPWDQTLQVGPATLRAFKVAHWGARMRSDTFRGFNGYIIEAGKHRILFGGDTAYTPDFKQLRSATPFDLAIMPIGAYDPWIHVHCNPEQALQMANDANAARILPVHHQTFHLSHEPVMQPMERLRRALGPDQNRLLLTEIGAQATL